MATSLRPNTGAVAYGSYSADYASFDIDAGQAVDNVTPYGSNISTKNIGSGTPDFSFNIGAFATRQTASSQPHLSDTSTIFSYGGATCTLTLDSSTTSCSYSFTGIVQRFRIGHARMRGFVPVGISLRNAGEVTESWQVS